METRDELLAATVDRYRVSSRPDRGRIFNEFAATTGYHSKHAMRLRRGGSQERPTSRASPRLYDDRVRAALVVLWGASDRICGKRLKALLPILVPAMERHGHLGLDAAIRTSLLGMSAATIDRSLQDVRREAKGRSRRKRSAVPSVCRSVPIRTFSDWNDPAPGFCEADLVLHCGTVTSGSFVQTLVLTDIATGWTECAPLLCVAVPLRQRRFTSPRETGGESIRTRTLRGGGHPAEPTPAKAGANAYGGYNGLYGSSASGRARHVGALLVACSA